MVYKKRRITAIVAIILIIITLFLIFNGITIQVYGLFCINTKYYDDAMTAFEREYSDLSPYAVNIVSIKNKSVFDLDNSNSVLVATINDNEVLIAQLKSFKGKYFSIGIYNVYEINNLSYEIDDNGKIDDCLGYVIKNEIMYSDVQIKYLICKDDYQVSNDYIYRTKITISNDTYNLYFLFE